MEEGGSDGNRRGVGKDEGGNAERGGEDTGGREGGQEGSAAW